MQKTICKLVIALGILLGAGVRAGCAADDRIRQWAAPNHRVLLSSVAGPEEDGLTEYDLMLIRVGNKPLVVDRYFRDVSVAWSPDSKYVAITDWIGSNVADCYIIALNTPTRRLSVTSILPKLSERLNNSHLYVSCTSWVSAGDVSVRVFGHTDYPPYQNFDHRFVYRAGARKIMPR